MRCVVSVGSTHFKLHSEPERNINVAKRDQGFTAIRMGAFSVA